MRKINQLFALKSCLVFILKRIPRISETFIYIQMSKQNQFQLFHRLFPIWIILTSPVTLLLTNALSSCQGKPSLWLKKSKDVSSLTSSM